VGPSGRAQQRGVQWSADRMSASVARCGLSMPIGLHGAAAGRRPSPGWIFKRGRVTSNEILSTPVDAPEKLPCPVRQGRLPIG
jgi:hypothetical protein